jgi:hypothetical protein
VTFERIEPPKSARRRAIVICGGVVDKLCAKLVGERQLPIRPPQQSITTPGTATPPTGADSAVLEQPSGAIGWVAGDEIRGRTPGAETVVRPRRRRTMPDRPA